MTITIGVIIVPVPPAKAERKPKAAASTESTFRYLERTTAKLAPIAKRGIILPPLYPIDRHIAVKINFKIKS